MALRIYAYVSTLEESNTSINAFNPFDSDSYSSGQSFNRVSSTNGMTWTPASGTFRVDHTGSYLVMVTPAVGVDSAVATNIIETQIRLNGTSSVKTRFNVNPNLGPSADGLTERTSYAVLKNLSVGDEIDYRIDDLDDSSPPLGDFSARPGTSIMIYKLDQGFGDYHLSSKTSPDTANSYNPFDNLVAPGNAATLVRTLDDNNFVVENVAKSGSFKMATASLGIVLSNIYSDVGSGGPNVDIAYIKNNTQVGVDYRVKLNSTNKPNEGTVMVMDNFAADDLVRVEVDPASVFTVNSTSGSGLSLFTVESGTHYSYVNVQTDAVDLASGVFGNAFATGSYSSFSAISNSSGINYDSSIGRFTVTRAGDYALFLNSFYVVPGDTLVEAKISKNGSDLFIFTHSVDTGDDPTERTSIYVLTGAVSGTYFDISYRGTSNGLRLKEATSIIALELSGSPLPLNYIPQTTPGTLYGKDYTINTYGVNVLSAQYTRALGAPQVPFFLGTPGPASLRNRENAAIVSTGKKKN